VFIHLIISKDLKEAIVAYLSRGGHPSMFTQGQTMHYREKLQKGPLLACQLLQFVTVRKGGGIFSLKST